MSSIVYEIDFGNKLFDNKVLSIIEEYIIQPHKDFIESLHHEDLVSNSISKVIYCFDLEDYVNKFNEQHQTNHLITKEKECSGVAKNLTCLINGKETVFIAINFYLLYNDLELLKQTLLHQFLIEKSNDFLPIEMLKQKNGISVEETQNLDIVISQLVSSWFSYWFVQKFESMFFNTSDKYIPNYKNYLINFKRNIKKLLYDVQSDDERYDGNWGYVWRQYIYNFSRLINNLLQFEKLSDPNSTQNIDELSIYSDILLEVKNVCNAIYEKKECNFTKLKELFLSIAKFYDIHIEYFGGNRLSFKIGKNPKALFSEVVETTPHFVSFVDILGFKDMINEYQKNPLSTLLQDLNKAFETSLSQTKKVFHEVKDNFLQYKLFSDNFSAAIPFFQSKEDYLHQFHLIIVLLQNYQTSMMSNGFFVRGGISDGDYFANDDMIFSGALVKAYNIESKIADCPRIVIDNEIINNIISMVQKEFPDNLKESIVFDSLSKLYFINPYINLKKQLNEMYNMEENEDDEILILLFKIFKAITEPVKDELTPTDQVQVINEKIDKEIMKIELLENKDDVKSGFVKRYKSLFRRLFNKKDNSKNKILIRYEWLKRFNQWFVDRNSSEFEFLENQLQR